MKTLKRLFHIAFGLWLVLVIAGCGYHVAGTTNSLPPHIRTIAIPVFSNNSSEPELHRDLSRAVLRSFVTDGRLRVVPRDKADLVLKGDLYHYKLKAVSFTSRDVVSEYFVELSVNVEVIDQVKNQSYLRKQIQKVKWDFRTDPNVILTEAARQEALQNAYRELGNRLVSLVVDQF